MNNKDKEQKLNKLKEEKERLHNRLLEIAMEEADLRNE